MRIYLIESIDMSGRREIEVYPTKEEAVRASEILRQRGTSYFITEFFRSNFITV